MPETVSLGNAPYRERIERAVTSDLLGRGIHPHRDDLEDQEYGVWNLAPGGLLVSFAPDEVADNEAGDLTVLVPLADVDDLLRPGAPVPTR